MKSFSRNNDSRGGFKDRRGGDRNDRGGFKPRSFGGDRDRSDRGGFKPRSFGRGGGFGDRQDRPMYDAVCANCGRDCKVPFNPTGDKPVYCSDCFEQFGGRDGGFKGNDSYGDNKRFEHKHDHYDNSYSSNNSNSGTSTGELKELFAKLDKKLDTVIDLLTLIAEKKTIRVGSVKKGKVSSPVVPVVPEVKEEVIGTPQEEQTPAGEAGE